MKFAVKIISIILLGLAALSACQNESVRRPKDPLAEGYQHIDRGEYTAAIEELTALSGHDPRPEVLVTLASAHAARGGIKVGQYWGFVIGFKAPLMKAEDVPVNASIVSLQNIAKQADGRMNAKDLEALGGLVRVMALWDLYQDRINAIPVVTGTAAQDLVSAIEILSRVQTPGGRLYRAILDLILFKSTVMASPQPMQEFSAVLQQTIEGKPQALCNFDVTKFTRWLRPASSHLNDALTDLSIAFPEQRGQLLPALNQLSQLDRSIESARTQLRQKRGCE